MVRSSRRRRQSGAALVTVMVFMAFLMLFGGAFVNHALTSEGMAVERSLADLRAHWAMTGQLNYMLSRAAFQGLCASKNKEATQALNIGENCDTTVPTTDDDGVTGAYPSYGGRDPGTRVGSLQDYLVGTGEIQSGDIDAPGVTYWYYPQNLTSEIQEFAPTVPLAANAALPYQFAVRGVVSERDDRNGNTAYDGQVRVDFEVLDADDGVDEGTAPAINDLKHRVGRLTFGLCVVDADDSGTSGAAKATTDTQFCRPDLLEPNVVEGAASIQFIQREYPLP